MSENQQEVALRKSSITVKLPKNSVVWIDGVAPVKTSGDVEIEIEPKHLWMVPQL